MPRAFELSLRFGGKRFRDADVGLQFFAKQLDTNAKKLNPAIQRQMKNLIGTITAALDARHSTPWRAGSKLPSGPRAGRLAQRSGNAMFVLRQASRVKGGGGETQGLLIGPSYLAVHEEGAVIRPTKKQYLAIPLPAALDSRGIPKRPSTRSWRNTFVARTRRGNLIIFTKERGLRGGREVTPLYLLTKEVRIPQRLGMAETVQLAVPVFEDRLFDSLSRELLKGL